MKEDITLTLLPEEAADDILISKKIKEALGIPQSQTIYHRIIRRSIDARKNPVKVNLSVSVSDNPVDFNRLETTREYKKVKSDAHPLVIVGAGPAGLFAALKAIELGYKPVVIERGVDVDQRRKDIALISKKGEVNRESNFCFGEGGAGTFSDGKLYTRSKKRGNNREILEILYQFGAPEDILIDSHPHIGTDKLSVIIKNIRNKIIECGGEVKFGCKMEKIIIQNGRAIGVQTSQSEKIEGPVFLAIGHSARDTYRSLAEEGVTMEPKALAIGVRLEHPQELIDKIQYHNKNGRGAWLPPAEYSFVSQSDGRGVYTFCMCPGGVIVPAVSDKNQIVVNGMSSSSRTSKWANSGYVVEIHPGDISGFERRGLFEMMEIQETLERKFSEESGNKLNAPAQRISDFLRDKKSNTLPSTSYAPGIHSTDFTTIFPKEISKRLKEGLKDIGKKCKEFISEKGVMIGLESRTSSPIRIPRNPETLSHIDIKDLYPMGEGAGYAGGIVSSAIDGMRCIESFHNKRE